MPPPRIRSWSWRSRGFRSVVYQCVALGLVLAVAAYLIHNTQLNLRTRGIHSGFEFLSQPAGFSIGESLIPFESSESFGKAFLVGLGNTMRAAIAGIVLSTLLGLLLGVGQLSRNLLLRSLCGGYVEAFRNVPLLLQLFIWYFVLTDLLPPIDAALQPLSGVYFSKNGLQYPIPVWAAGHGFTLGGLVLGLAGARWWSRRARHHQDATGDQRPVLWPGLGIVLAGVLLGWWVGGMPAGVDMPEKTLVTVVGGGSLTPEFLSVVIGLSLYNAAFIAEIVRAGIQSVPFGQHEAALALGLSRRAEIRLVQLPQSLRVIIPPLTNQYLNLTKNTSLAVAVGYPELISISNTSLNQTGRAIECIVLVMACYLTLSLATAWFMNVYNQRALLKER